jgi:hypothetical protein
MIVNVKVTNSYQHIKSLVEADGRGAAQLEG